MSIQRIKSGVIADNAVTSEKFASSLTLPANVAVTNGIAFPATQSASANANTLDDYEQGTFTLVATPDSGSITLTNTTAFYVKIGRVVHIFGTVTASAVSSPNGNVFFTAPFTCRSRNNSGSVATVTGFNTFSGFIPVVRIQDTQSFFYLQKSNVTNGTLDSAASLFTSSTAFEFQITYLTDD
jgi:hypothetical protein